MKNLLRIILIPSLLLLFSNCKKEPDEGKFLGEIRFTQDELSYFPYKENDSLVFKNAQGDSNVYHIINIEKGVYPLYEKPNDVRSDYYLMENIQIVFDDYNNAGIKQLIHGYKQHGSQPTYISSRFSPPNLTNNDSTYKIFHSYMDSNKFCTSSDVYHSSISILNNTYNDVYELKNSYQYFQNSDILQSIYYAKNVGIVGFKTKSGTEWYLD